MPDIIHEILKRPGHRLVVLQNGGILKVPNAVFRDAPFKAGEPLDVEGFWQSGADKARRFALEAAVRLLEARDRSEAEIRDRLSQIGYPDSAIDAACARLKDAGYLNDARYARELACRLQKKYGPIRVRQELRHRGIGAGLIEKLLAESELDSQLEAAVALARKAIRGRGMEKDALYRKAYGALARRGYPPDLVRRALSLALEADLDE